MKKALAVLSLATTASVFATSAQAQTACVFDLMGTGGDAYSRMKDYALQAKKWGVNLKLKVHTDERVATEDFIAGKCDMAVISGIRGRQFNKFVGSIDAIGATVDDRVAKNVITLMNSPKIASKMKVGSYEVVGVLPLGAAYLLVNDRSINTLAKAAGKKVAVLDYDKSQAKLVQRVGAQPVSSDITSFGSKFNNGQVDVIAAPAIAFKPLELYKGLGTKGGIVNFPIAQITGNLIIRSNKFPAGFGQKSRTYISGQLQKAFNIVDKEKKSIPKKYWMDIPANDKAGYVKLMREARIDMTKDGFYDKSMMSLLKKLRCKYNNTAECAMKDE